MRLIFAILISFVLFSCKQKEKCTTCSAEAEAIKSIEFKYAKGLAIEVADSITYITIKHPSTGEIIQKLLVSPSPIKTNNSIWIKSNPSSIFSSSVTHIAFLDALDKNDFLKGFSQTKYIYNPDISKKVETGKILEVGNEDILNFEKVIANKPDLFFISGLLGKSAQFEKISQAGIPVIEVIEWLEVHPLARAEWVKFFATFYGQHTLADSIFNEIEKKYFEIKSTAKSINKKPLVMSGKSFKGTWWMPGGRNYSSILTNDAGGFYPYYSVDTNTNSLPLSLEKVVSDFLDADFWISPGANSLKELISEESRYADFKPVIKQNVYEPNNRSLFSGANDFWETGMLRPDLLLKDLVRIFHPELLPNHELYFYKKLE